MKSNLFAAMTRRIRAGFCAAVGKSGAALWAGKRARLAQAVLRLAARPSCCRNEPGQGTTARVAEEAMRAEAAAALAAARENAGAAFLPDGCIGSQRALFGVPFGKHGNSPDNGCGWIACYNAMHLAGIAADPAAVLAGIGRGARRGGKSGTSPFALVRFLRRQGIRVQTAVTGAEAEALARRVPAFLVCYLYRQGDERLGGHFVAGRYDAESGMLRVYNGERGPVSQETSVAAIDVGRALIRLLIGLSSG